MRRKLAIAAFSLLVSSTASAQGLKTGNMTWAGEYEFTNTFDVTHSSEFYVFGNHPTANVWIEGLFVKEAIHRGEASVGKTFLVPRPNAAPWLILKPYAGLTTDSAVFTPIVAIANVWGRTGVYIGDPKFYYDDKANTLYQKAIFGLDKAGAWQLRWERYQLFGVFTAFNRFGIERRFFTPSNRMGLGSHIQVAALWETQNEEWCLAVGYRWQ